MGAEMCIFEMKSLICGSGTLELFFHSGPCRSDSTSNHQSLGSSLYRYTGLGNNFRPLRGLHCRQGLGETNNTSLYRHNARAFSFLDLLPPGLAKTLSKWQTHATARYLLTLAQCRYAVGPSGSVVFREKERE